MRLGAAILAGLIPLATACGAPPVKDAAALVALGRKIFFDTSLSASGHMSCATCHDPAHAYGPPDGNAVRYGGADLHTPGTRAVPSLRYILNRTPVWFKQYQSDPAERVIETDSVPTGGFDWDGRFDSLPAQAASPFFAANEMSNPNVAAVVTKLAKASYASELRAVFGVRMFDDMNTAFGNALLAIERFELDDISFHPYSSRFDAYLDGKVRLSAAESRGLRLFTDPLKGNCSACHTAAPGVDGSHPLFTDFSFAALGVPRNPAIPANSSSDYYDLGLCGPLRQDQVAQRRWCGMFKTPSLRNAATRGAFFHNGSVHTLRDAVRFYAERDRRPEQWYTHADRTVQRFDDLPAALRGNVDQRDAPLNRSSSDAAALTAADVDDIVAFIVALSDSDVIRQSAP